MGYLLPLFLSEDHCSNQRVRTLIFAFDLPCFFLFHLLLLFIFDIQSHLIHGWMYLLCQYGALSLSLLYEVTVISLELFSYFIWLNSSSEFHPIPMQYFSTWPHSEIMMGTILRLSNIACCRSYMINILMVWLFIVELMTSQRRICIRWDLMNLQLR